jgi:hypothetical protein
MITHRDRQASLAQMALKAHLTGTVETPASAE